MSVSAPSGAGCGVDAVLPAEWASHEPVGLAGWVLRLYPAAGEAGGSWQSGAPRKSRKKVIEVGDRSGLEVAGPVPAADPVASMEAAGKRARGKLRRYGTANGLNRLGTLTYRGEGCHDECQVRADVAAFWRAVRDGLGGERFPYLWVPEWHKTAHGLHLHFAVGRYVPRRLIEDSWPHGFVHIKLIGDLPVGSGQFAEARKAAGYLGKYVGKDFAAPKTGGLHRYEVAQGFQPESEQLNAWKLDDVIAQAALRIGCEPRYMWQSSSDPEWSGPPAVWLSW